MKYLRLLAIVMPVLLITGCKIRMVVPEGGRVATSSGAYSCAAGSTCEIDVVDIFFDQTFIAQPAAGYEFKGWRKKMKGFCGGKSTPCRLYTSGFEGNPALMGFLESDDVFFLEPVFERHSSGNGRASACYREPAMLEDSTVTTTYRDLTSGRDTTTTTRTVVGGQVNFNGYLTTEMILTTDTVPEITNTNYVRLDRDEEGTYWYGGISIDPRLDLVSTNKLEPPRFMPWYLEVGETYSQSFDIHTTTVIEGRESRETSRVDLTMTNHGVESVSVPAGTFDACRITETQTLTIFGSPETNTVTYWISADVGVHIKSKIEIPGYGEQIGVLVSVITNGISVP